MAVIVILTITIVFGSNNFYVQRADKVSRMSEQNVFDSLSSISIDDLIAMVFWDKDDSENLRKVIVTEKENGLRDEERIESDS